MANFEQTRYGAPVWPANCVPRKLASHEARRSGGRPSWHATRSHAGGSSQPQALLVKPMPQRRTHRRSPSPPLSHHGRAAEERRRFSDCPQGDRRHRRRDQNAIGRYRRAKWREQRSQVAPAIRPTTITDVPIPSARVPSASLCSSPRHVIRNNGASTWAGYWSAANTSVEKGRFATLRDWDFGAVLRGLASLASSRLAAAFFKERP